MRRFGGNDHVAAAEHRGVTGKAIAGDNADDRYQSRKFCKLHKGCPSRPVTPTDPYRRGRPPRLGSRTQRHPPLLGKAQHAVDLLWSYGPGCGQHRVIIGDHHAAGAFGTEFFRVHVATPEIRPSAGVFMMRSSTLRRRRCARSPASHIRRTALIDELRDVFARVGGWLVLRRRSTEAGRFSSSVIAWRAISSARSGRM